jgi:hypothetical protein
MRNNMRTSFAKHKPYRGRILCSPPFGHFLGIEKGVATFLFCAINGFIGMDNQRIWTFSVTNILVRLSL